jgi:hypothetical protein
LRAEKLMQNTIELLAILDEAIGLVSLPDNNFAFSSWAGAGEAAGEIQMYRSEILRDDFTHLPRLEVIFGPTGPLQELSLDSDWSTTFLELAEKFDRVAQD